MKDLHNENIKNERDGVIFLIFMVVFLISVFIWKSFSSEKDEPEKEEPGSEIEDYFVAKYTERMMNKDVDHR